MKESLLAYWLEAKESILSFLGIFFLSLWAGTASFMDLNKDKPFSLKSYLAHIISASFAGVMAYFMCEVTHITGPLLGATCGLAAHIGTPALLKLRVFRGLIGK